MSVTHAYDTAATNEDVALGVCINAIIVRFVDQFNTGRIGTETHRVWNNRCSTEQLLSLQPEKIFSVRTER